MNRNALTIPLTAAVFSFTALGFVGISGAQNTGINVAQSEEEEPVRNIDEWDLPKSGEKLAIGGYDPVAYFPEGGSKATKGKKNITTTHLGVTYRFSSQDNKERFLERPDRYEAAHGGWCSWAMHEGDKTEPDPKTFIVKDDRLFLFYNGFWGNTKNEWEKGDHEQLANDADNEWKQISGEAARQVPLPEDDQG